MLDLADPCTADPRGQHLSRPLGPVVGSAGLNCAQRAVGYYRIGETTQPDKHRASYLSAINTAVERAALVLTGIYTDVQLGPASERPGLRTVLDVIDHLDVHVLVIPSLWHLSQEPDEVADLKKKIAFRECELLIVRGGH